VIAKKQLHQHELIAMKHNRVLIWENVKEDSEGLELFLALE
jgi:hypothetical protein